MKKTLILVMTTLMGVLLVFPNLILGAVDVYPISFPRQGETGGQCEDQDGNGGGSSGGGGGFHLEPLTIEGDETIIVGSQYAASGGIRPYQWTLSSGSIDNTGKVTALVECSDTVQVKVVDAMGIQASKVTTKGTSPLSLTGTETPVAASQYAASGGTLPYLFSISCGTIDSTGKVTGVAGCCGSGAVTVTDSCGQQVQKEVRFPGGKWVLISDEDFRGQGCLDWGYSSSQLTQPTCISGQTKIVEYHQWHRGYDANGNMICYPNSCPAAQCFDGACRVCYKRQTYKWQCP